MDLQLKNKKAFVSGSTSGIGYGVAKWLLSEGASVVINGRKQYSITTAIESLRHDYPEAKVSGLQADFEKVDHIDRLISELGDIDILINNVGIYASQSFYDMSDEEWLRHFQVNVMSGVRLSRKLLPKMIQKNWGRIIFISSECASIVPTDMIAYSMTKTAMHTVSRGLAQLAKGTGVTVNTVMPGSTMTEGAITFLEGVASQENKTKEEVADEFFTNVRTSSLLQRFATVDEIASTICYLVSPLAAATNGSSIKIDGGSTGGIM